MIIGVPKEIKNSENRVGLIPAGVHAFVAAGHRCLVQTGAGTGSAISDDDYKKAGAEILPDAVAVYSAAEMIIKVKEPLTAEYELIQERQILYAYLHLAPEPELTKVLLKKKVISIAYETVEGPDGTLPLLIPMSEIAGRMSIQVGAQFLEKHYGGKGVLLGGVPGVEPATVVIVGGGTVGTQAAKMAVGLGAQVVIIDKTLQRLRELDDLFEGRVVTVMSSAYNLARWVQKADLLIGAVLLPGARAPKLITEEMVRSMTPGAVIVDVAIDQGGSVETIDRVTTHSDPVYIKHGVVHYAVANIPGAVARTSTFALTNATLDYGLKLANMGYLDAIRSDAGIAKGVNTIDGKLTYKAVASSLRLRYTPLSEVIGDRRSPQPKVRQRTLRHSQRALTSSPLQDIDRDRTNVGDGLSIRKSDRFTNWYM